MKLFIFIFISLFFFAGICTIAQTNNSETIYISNASSSLVNGTYSAISKDINGYDAYANPSPVTESSIFLYRYNDTHWIIGAGITFNGGDIIDREGPAGSEVYYYIETASQTPDNLTFTNTGVLGEAPYPTSSNTPLPVELSLFSATVNDKDVELLWVTATEVNNYGFEIERQYQMLGNKQQEWQNICFIEGHGNSNSPKYYSYPDNSIESSGKYFYRLKQTDIDGTFDYSDVVEASIVSPNNFELLQNYPNPFNPTTSISYTIPGNGNVTLSIYDILGNRVALLENGNRTAGSYSTSFDASKLTSGIYFYTIRSGNFTETKKMLLMK